ncbi:MAG: hypothetical protein AAB566_00640 [Patescibacteria group bacterium]
MKKSPVKILLLDSYLATIKNGVGTKLFRNLFVRTDNKRRDILENGRLSCAVFTSAILLMFGLIKESHATVSGLIKDLEKSGWKKIAKPRPGAILIWDYQNFGKERHRHSGFYIGDRQAISNSKTKRSPSKHHWTYGVKNGKVSRKVIAIYWSKKLGM